MEKNISCNDCKRELIKDEEYMPYKVGENTYAKCKVCYEVDPVLRDFQECQVYSRVVGFHTNIKNWNDAKAEEWKDRKTYDVNASFSTCCSQ